MSTAHDAADSPPQRSAGGEGELGQIGPYKLQKKIGAGGMGTVYLALDTRLKRNVALKVLPPEKAENPILVKRFKSEAEKAAQLKHDNIVGVYDAGEADGCCYIAMEYIEGIDVHDLVARRGVLPFKRSLDIIKQVAMALEVAAEKSIVHRDIKPSNLMIRRDGVVKLADMGLARSMDETVETGITRAGTTVGTVDYMSPEQARDSKAADLRSDIYSLGCTWYHMLTGSPPFPDGSLTNKLRAHAHTHPPDPRARNPNVPEAAIAVIHRMMAKKPDDRYQTPTELIEDLDQVLHTRRQVTQTILSGLNDEYDSANLPPPPAPSAEGRSDGHRHEARGRKAKPAETLAETPMDAGPATRHVASGASGASPQARDSGAPSQRPASDNPGAEIPNDANDPPVDAPRKGKRSGLVSEQDYYTSGRLGEGTSGGAPRAERDEPAGSPRPRPLPPKEKPVVVDDPEKDAENRKKWIVMGLVGLIVLAVGASLFQLIQSYGGGFDLAGPQGMPYQAPVDPSAAPVGTNPDGTTDPSNPGTTTTAGDGRKNLPGNQATGPTKSNPLVIGPNGSRPSTLAPLDPEQVAKRREQELKQLPKWVDDPLPVHTQSRFTVGGALDGATRRNTLNEALADMPPAGGLVELIGEGPFLLRPIQAPRSLVTIRAHAAARPLIVLTASGEAVETLLSLSDGQFELQQLDFVVRAEDFPTSDPLTVLGVQNGNLFLRDCSFSLIGERAGPTTAVRLAGEYMSTTAKAVVSSNFLCDKVLLRGPAFRGFEIDVPQFDFVARDSLLVVGKAAGITVGGKFEKKGEQERKLRFVSTTLSSAENAFRLDAASAAQPVPTTVFLLNSLVAAPGGADDPALLYLNDWPTNSVRTATDGPFRNLKWDSQQSLCTGWKPIVQFNTADLLTVGDAAQWCREWKNDAQLSMFRDTAWPKFPPRQPAEEPLDAWAAETLPGHDVRTDDGGVPGCQVAMLRLPAIDSVGAAQALAHRPAPPAARAWTREPVRIDVTKQDLGRQINEGGWPDGTTFIAAGFGARTSSPITVKGKSLRIQFEQGDGPPLVISVRPVDASRAPPPDAAFIRVTGGDLELVRAQFSIPHVDRQAVPEWLVHVAGGNLTLRGCRLQGSLLKASKNGGLIRWSGAPSEAATTPFRGYAFLEDSFLAGTGTLISADLERRALLLRNTIAVSRDDLFVGVFPGVADSQSAIDVESASLSAGGTFFQFETGSSSAVAREEVRVFASETACVAPIKAAGSGFPLLVGCGQRVRDDKKVIWWEDRCGYAPEITRWLVAGPRSADVKPQNFDVWTSAWGAENVLRPVRGAGSVLLKTPLPSKGPLTPDALTLSAGCAAATAGNSGRPLGANVAQLEKLAPQPPPPAANPKTKPKPEQPRF